jgi:acetyl-CoA acetyltransferase family protein
MIYLSGACSLTVKLKRVIRKKVRGEYMRDVVVIDAVRSPCGIRTSRRYSDICRVMPDELLAYCLKALIERNNIDPAIVDDVICGTSDRPHNSGRIAALMAGFPPSVAGCQVNRQCAGAHSALHFAAMEIMTGYAEVTIACGVESMSRDFEVQREIHPTQSMRGAPVPPDYVPEMLVEVWKKYSPTGAPVTMGQSAEAIAHKYNISREEMDDFGFWSHQKAIKATREGKFKKEIVPIPVKTESGVKIVDVDETIRFDIDREKMRALPPAFIPPPFMGITEGRVTAGNSAPVSDGAAAALLMSREKAKELGLEPRAVLKADRMCVLGVDPGPYQLLGPIPATKKVLMKSGLTLDKIEWFEVNEAFASVVIAWAREMGIDWRNEERLNPHGGAIALGHPLGETGVKLLATAINGMEDRDLRYGLITMCVGLGQGIATIIERET